MTILLLRYCSHSYNNRRKRGTTITATLDQASSKDVVLPILLSGTAGLNVDYTSSFPSKEESLIATIQGYSNSYVQLSDGRYVFFASIGLIIYDQLLKY
jgi:hypothetical protein